MKYRFLYTAVIGAIVGIMPSPANSAEETEVKITKRDCKRVVAHQARDDVAYKPGVDVRGRKVKPADLDGRKPLKLPNELTIDIGIDLGKRLGIGDDGNKFSGDTNLGKVKYDIKSGKMTFNGQPIGSSEQAAIAAKCRELLSKGK